MAKTILTPIKVDKPPRHTQVMVRCLTCTKHSVCRIREDYLKTAIAIQNILGDPQEDYELSCEPTKLSQEEKDLFPITIEANEKTGNIIDIYYFSTDFLAAYYKFDDYVVCFKINYDNDSYTVASGIEAYYWTRYETSDESKESLSAAALNWRNNFFEKEEKKEYVNTTYFSATLNCQFYEYDKGMTNEKGFDRMFCKCDTDEPHHLATLHQFAPIPCPKKVCRRKNVEI